MVRNRRRRRLSWGSTSFTLKGSSFTRKGSPRRFTRKGLALLLWFGLTTSQLAWSGEDTTIINESTYKIRFTNGQEQIVYRGSPVFYKDSIDQWQKIDPTWKNSGDTLAYVKTGVYRAKVDTLGNVRVRFKNREIGWRLAGLVYFDDSNKNRQVIRATSWKKPTLRGDSLIFSNVFPGVGYALRYHNQALIGYLRISSAARAALPSPAGVGIDDTNAWLCLVYRMDLSDLKDLYEGRDSVRWADRYDTDRPVIIRHSPDSIWGLFPQEIIYTTDTLAPKPLLRKTFVKVGDNFLMILGYKYTDFVNLPAGAVIFDDAVQIKGTTKITDSYLNSALPTLNYGSSTANYFGKDGSGNKLRMVIRWDVTDIPVGSTVTAAVDSHYYDLGLSCTTVGNDFDMYRVTRYWEENECGWTYAERNPDVSWTTAGGDYSGLITSAFIGYPNGWITVSGFQAAVQNWLDGTWVNNGCLWRHTDEFDNNTCKVVHSSEHATNDTRLYVTYTPPAAGGEDIRRQRLLRLGE